MKQQNMMKVDVELNALCYALWQAEDYIPVVYLEAEYDEMTHFLQVLHLAKACYRRYQRCSEEERANCHQWSPRIIAIANCFTLEEYKQL